MYMSDYGDEKMSILQSIPLLPLVPIIRMAESPVSFGLVAAGATIGGIFAEYKWHLWEHFRRLMGM